MKLKLRIAVLFSVLLSITAPAFASSGPSVDVYLKTGEIVGQIASAPPFDPSLTAVRLTLAKDFVLGVSKIDIQPSMFKTHDGQIVIPMDPDDVRRVVSQIARLGLR